MKDFGPVRISTPTPEDLSDPEFSCLSLIGNEVLSDGYKRQDEFADEKLQATIALYLRAVLEAAPNCADREYHFMGEDGYQHERLNGQMVDAKEKVAKIIRFRPSRSFTVSIPPYLKCGEETPGLVS